MILSIYYAHVENEREKETIIRSIRVTKDRMCVKDNSKFLLKKKRHMIKKVTKWKYLEV